MATSDRAATNPPTSSIDPLAAAAPRAAQTGSSLCLEPLQDSTLTAVVELDGAVFGGLWSLEGYQREIHSPNSDVWVLRELGSDSLGPGAVVGVACIWAIVDEAQVMLLGVLPSYRRRGLGQGLLAYLLELAIARGLTWASLEVRASNQSAQRLYASFGFMPVGRRRDYYPASANCPAEDAILLELPQLQSALVRDRIVTLRHQAQARFGASGLSLAIAQL